MSNDDTGETEIGVSPDLATRRIIIPKRKQGRQSARAIEAHEAQMQAFCDLILDIDVTLAFPISSRSWCYQLEEHGLTKGDFDDAQDLMVQCRKSGRLPINICAPDGRRYAANLEHLHDSDPDSYADSLIEGLRNTPGSYHPFSFWDTQEYYVEMIVEKVDLKSLFLPVCQEYFVPLANNVGWGDLNQKAALMERFAAWEAKGKKCVLLYCGDHDPAGLNISHYIKSNLEDIADAVGWWPDDLEIVRFGLNYDFIQEQRLTWIDNLETGSGRRLG